MEMKKLHLGTMSYGFDSMDEVAHQLATAYGSEGASRSVGYVRQARRLTSLPTL
jgi:phospholipid-translocating ATPase